MSGTNPASAAATRYAQLRQAEAVSPKLLYALDARAAADSPVHDLAALTAVARAAGAAGAGHVLDATHVIFPNGAITLVLILAESHLSIHTWPEESLVAIDLFSCGAIDGQAVIDHLVTGLRLDSAAVSLLPRGLPGPAAPPTGPVS
jgi:S-adenosylmethionine decarboxylase